MSTYKRLTKNPETKQFELATWVDNHFGEHNYGVIFDSHPNVVFDPREESMETKDFNTSGSNAIGYEKQLYKVYFINQITGDETFAYVASKGVDQIIKEYADVLKVEFLMPFEDLTENNE